MTDLAISAHALGKRYQLGERERYRALRDSLAGVVRRPFRGKADRRDAEILWALADVSFDVQRGEVMGLIGRNGSGKSTLLKVLSRITEPTTGSAVVSGRVGSLLEVGTGFHPELTGRENVFLNGAILGMQRSEIRRKFDEIIAFAEIERFVDTPVKRYSSGMYVRLAFSVAAHLEPEILLVDEVLAVGDSAFQKKCLGKMNEVAGEGRTVMFVSHDMTNISVLCDTALLLQHGRVLRYGPAHDVIDFYVNQDVDRRSSIHWAEDDAPGDDLVRMTHVGVCRPSGLDADAFALPEPIGLAVEYTVRQPGARLNPVFIVRNTLGTTLFSTANYEDPEWGSHVYAPGTYRSECSVPAHVLNDGTYEVEALIVEETRDVRARASDAVEFSVYDDGSTRGGYVGPWDGLVRPRCSWHTSQRVGVLHGS